MCVPYLFISINFIYNAGLDCVIKLGEIQKNPPISYKSGEFADPAEWHRQVLLQLENGTKICKR